LAVLFCILPPTRIALGHLPPDRVPDGSALYNLMRNLGGAIGIALIDTVVFGRVEKHAAMIFERLEARDRTMFEFTGLPFIGPEREVTQNMILFATPIVKNSALTIAINEAWMMLAAITAIGILLALLVRNPKKQADAAAN
jgi:DHA2 family multidrug resistance protein